MGAQRLSWLLRGLLIALCVDIGCAFQLEPVDLLQHRDNQFDHSHLDLLKQETFLWGGMSSHPWHGSYPAQENNTLRIGAVNGRYALGNFTVFMPSDKENIISLEKVYPMLTSTSCTSNSISLNFKDEKSYRYGYEAWNWVNKDKHRTFLLVAGAGHCRWNTDRLPFVVENVLFNNKTKTIKAVGEVSEWKKVAHSYELTVGGRPSHSSKSKGKRDYERVYTLGVNYPLPLSKRSFGGSGFKFNYDCSSCSTKGEFEFDFHIKTTFGIPDDVSMVLTPHGVAAIFTPHLGLSADLTGNYSKTWDLGEIPIGGFSIGGGILDIGPKIVFQAGLVMGPLQGSAGIQLGGTASLPDASELSIDLMGPDISSSGWSPSFAAAPVTVDAAISGSVQVTLGASVDLTLQALGMFLFHPPQTSYHHHAC